MTIRGGTAARLGAAGWLSLAASPTFAMMALLTGLTGGEHTIPLCSQAGPPTPLAGMMPMYLLMAAFHLAPWLRLTEKQFRERIPV